MSSLPPIRQEELLERTARFFDGLQKMHFEYTAVKNRPKSETTAKAIKWFHRCMVLPLDGDMPIPNTEPGALE